MEHSWILILAMIGHVLCGHTEEGLKLTNDFFGKTSATMIGCYAGMHEAR
ncbi:MAG: hypothetical protein IJ106_14320 [Parasporobacterium sp.]|nr:hypothetical protein [Parasporobacterium sp.]